MPFSDYSTALVTGASTGMGAAIAERLTKRGLTVHAVARNDERLKELADKTGAIPHVVDLTDTAALTAAVGKLEIDVLVNCAGVSRPGNIYMPAFYAVITALGTLAAVSTVKDRAHLPLRDA